MAPKRFAPGPHCAADSTAVRTRAPIIDALRGSAILCVILFHVFVRTNFTFAVNLSRLHFDARNTVQAGFLGVSLFFFVSGFCLMLPYALAVSGERAMPTWKEYASRRFWKIVPSYYLALGLMLLAPVDPGASVPRTLDGALHGLFLYGFNAATFTSLNSNFWSLAVEVQFYLIFPLLVFGFARAPLIATSVATLTALVYSLYIARGTLDRSFFWSYQLPSLLPLFVFGSLTAWIYVKFIRGRSFSPAWQRQSLVMVLTSAVVLEYLFDQVNRAGGGPSAWAWENAHRLELGAALCVLALSACCTSKKVQRAIANPILVFFSDISYNMYLWNAPVIALVASHVHGDDGWRGGVFMLLAVGGASLIGYLITTYFERPLMRRMAGRYDEQAARQT